MQDKTAATDVACSSNVTFAAGETKAIVVEYYDRKGEATMHLKVSGPGISTQVVPTGWLSTDPGTAGPNWTFSDGDVSISNARPTGAGVTLMMSDGSTVEYKKSATGAYVGPEGDGTSVSVDPTTGQISVTADGGTSYTYDKNGLLLSAVSATDDRSPATKQMIWTGNPPRLTGMRDPVSTQTGLLQVWLTVVVCDHAACAAG